MAIGVMLSGLVGTAESAPMQWSSAVGGNGHWYEAIQYSGTWDMAHADAQTKYFNSVQGHLATLTSLEENNFVWDNLGINEYWLGGYQTDKNAEPAGDWAWVSGEKWDWTNWDQPAEPNNAAGDEDYIQFYSYNGSWNDKHVGSTAPGYVIEYAEYCPAAPVEQPSPAPEPATMLLFGTGIAGLVGNRFRKRKI